VFCPNCGTQSPDSAQACPKCNFHLKSIAAPKFKGTMLMMGQPSHPVVPPPGAAPAARSGSGGPIPGAPPAARPVAAKGTFVGVAPMANTARATAASSPPAPNAALPLPPVPNPPLDIASAFSPTVAQPGAVNPLAGTFAVSDEGFAASFPPPPAPGGSPRGAPAGPTGTTLMAAQAPYGAPLPLPASAPPGPPPPFPLPRRDPPNTSPQPNPFAGPPPGHSPRPALRSLADSLLGHPRSAAAPAGPQHRDPRVTFLVPLGMVFGGVVLSTVLWMIFWPLGVVGDLVVLAGVALHVVVAIPMVNEVKAVTRNDGFAWWPLLVPLYNVYWAVVLLPEEIKKAKQLLGVKQAVRPPVLYFFALLYALASDVNDLVR